MDQALVPPHPVVEIVVSGDAVTVDGVVVDRGSAGGPDEAVAMHLGIHAAARQVAQQLGRPVRAILRTDGDEKQLVIHPDGSVSDVEDTFPIVSLLAPAGARGALIVRHTRRPDTTKLRARRKDIAVRVAYVALATVLIGGIIVEARDDLDQPEVSAGPDEELPTLSEVEPPPVTSRTIAEGSRLERLPGIGDVEVRPDRGGFRLEVTTERALQVKVRATKLNGNDGVRMWTLKTDKAATRALTVDDLDAGAYRWVVQSPGEEPVMGRVLVQPEPEEPEVITVSTPAEPEPVAPPPTTDTGGQTGGNNDGGGGGGTDSKVQGPTKPIDPDDPRNP